MSVIDDLLEDGELFRDQKGRPRPWPRPLAPLADTHGHLTVFREHDPARAIARAALVGVRLLVVPADPTEDATDARAFLDSMGRWVEGARALLDEAAAQGLVPPAFSGTPDLCDNVRVVAGIHPYGAAQADEAAMARLSELLADPRCAGVGEIGLDFTCDVPTEVQREVFVCQLRLAKELGMPCELHIRDERNDEEALAHAMALEVLDEVGIPEAGVDLHCYTGDPAVMRPFVERGCMVAFGGAVTFKRSDEIRDAACACPADQILTETDSPYMAPVPLRGLECEPAMVCFSARCVADVRAECGVSDESETYAALWKNARRLFKF
ncbi:TatD family hydrolase [Atopobiaceae bacterium 24-176]